MKILLIENIKIALGAIRGQKLRTILTVMIIAVGIMALVGILTAIESLKSVIISNFSAMGANTFSISRRQMSFGHQNENENKYISWDEASRFKEIYEYPAITSLRVFATSIATVKYKDEKTNPNVQVVGIDENYLITSGYEIQSGRDFSPTEITFGSNSIILGSKIAGNVFKDKENPLGKTIMLGSGKFHVVGILKEKGSSMGFGDNNCFIPITNVRQNFPRPEMSVNISILVDSPEKLEPAINEAIGCFRVARKLRIDQENNFEITKSDSMAEMLDDSLKQITFAATLIGLITLLGAAIGLMNIMLVSVTERTQEIGIRKAHGATSLDIRNQFLTEAIVICQIGGIVGIILGIVAGNMVSFFMKGAFIVPWAWITLGIVLCFIVGLVSGIYPATKAASLNPIDSLRYE